MPSREEERAAGEKEAHSNPICPFCGKGDYLYKSRRQKGWWECANDSCRMYGKPFPSPRYGAKGKPSWLQKLLNRRRAFL
jgi:ribosomal protein L37AE/L43A